MNKAFLLLLSLVLTVLPQDAVAISSSENHVTGGADRTAAMCEDFAQRQLGIADALLSKNRYSRALKVLNRTVENCDRDFVREKIVEVFDAWFNSAQSQGTEALEDVMAAVSNHSYVSSSAKSTFENRMSGHVRSAISDEYNADNYRAAYNLCRSYSDYTSGDFRLEYYCGSSAEQLGAYSAAVASYEWMLENWSSGQSLATWNGTASTLERLYFLSGRFRSAYELARDRATRDPSPETVLTSLISLRGEFLSPVLRVGAEFFESDPSDQALSLVGREMQNVNFPKYVKSLYVLDAGGTVQRGLYGQEANPPGSSLLENAYGTLSLLQSDGQSNPTWLVSPAADRFLVLEFNVATTPEESVRLENVLEKINEDEQWKKLYDLQFEETAPASGSAVGTFLTGASLGGEDPQRYDRLFDDSLLLSYYCIQNDAGTIQGSYNFDRDDLNYGDDIWQETSETPALYHHATEYGGGRVREVVWPMFVNDKWTGVVRVGLARR